MQQPKSATFREGVVNSMRATSGAATDESPEADHPAIKYKVSGITSPEFVMESMCAAVIQRSTQAAKQSRSAQILSAWMHAC
jgi:hypothetical protein